MAYREELILEIKAEVKALNRALDEIKKTLGDAFKIEFKEVKENVKEIAKEAKEASKKLSFDEAEKDLKSIKNDIKEIKRVAKDIGSPFRRWLEDISNVVEIMWGVKELWGGISEILPFAKGIENLSNIENSLLAIAGIIQSISAGVSAIEEQIAKLEEKKIELEVKGDTREIEKIDKEISNLQKKIENLADLPRDFADALKEAQKASELLRRESLKSVATFQELLTIFQTISATGYSAGLSTEQLVRLTVLVSNAVKAMGLDLNQAAQEARDLIQGTIDINSQLAKSLGITSEIVQEWREAGTLYENITTSLQGFANASLHMQNTLSGIISNLKDAFDVITEISSKPLFDALKKDLKSILDNILYVKTEGKNAAESLQEMLNPSLISRAQALGEAFRVIYESLRSMLTGAAKAISDISRVTSVVLKPLKALQSSLEPLLNTVSEFAGYVATVGVILFSFTKLGIVLRVVRLLTTSFAQLRNIISAVVELFRNLSTASSSITNLKNAVLEVLALFRQLPLIAQSIIISLFLQIGQAMFGFFENVKTKIVNTFSNIILSVKQFWVSFLLWLAQTTSQVLSQIPGLGDFAQKLQKEVIQLRMYLEQLKQEKLQLKTELDKNKIAQDIFEIKTAIEQTQTKIAIDAQTTPLEQKLSQLKELQISKEIKFSAETIEVERVIEELSHTEITIPVKFVVVGDYSPSWE